MARIELKLSRIPLASHHMDTHVYNIQIRILIYQEDGEFVARALEMDLIGYGKTEAEAVEELKQSIECQLTFAHHMNDSSLLGFKAEDEFFQRWDQAQQKALKGIVLSDKPVKLSAKACVITFTQSELRSLREREFKKSELVCA
jgi:predicted RNase H-like HicB family nuclease